jgi:hypothetical protein
VNAPGDASLNAADRLAIMNPFAAYAQDRDAGKLARTKEVGAVSRDRGLPGWAHFSDALSGSAVIDWFCSCVGGAFGGPVCAPKVARTIASYNTSVIGRDSPATKTPVNTHEGRSVRHHFASHPCLSVTYLFLGRTRGTVLSYALPKLFATGVCYQLDTKKP